MRKTTLAVVLTVLAGCHFLRPAAETKPETKETVKSTPAAPPSAAAVEPKAADVKVVDAKAADVKAVDAPAGAPAADGSGSEEEECTHGDPEPILVSDGQAVTVVKKGKELTEALAARDGVKVTVRQFGCAHAATEYAFFIDGEDATTRKPGEWLKRAADLLEKIKVVDADKRAVATLVAALRKSAKAPYQLGDALSISEMDTVTVSAEPAAKAAKLVVLHDIAL